MISVECTQDGTIGNLSTDVFEPRTSTGSWIFPSLERFDAIGFVMSNRKHKNKSFAVHGNEQNHAKKENIRLPVAVRGSKTSVLKFPIMDDLAQTFKVKVTKTKNQHLFYYICTRLVVKF